jgi:phage tail tape-measure protein
MIEQAVYTILAGSTAVGALAGDRISPHQRVQGTALPAIVYQVEDLEPIRGLGGTAGLTAATLTVTSIAATYSGARGLAAAVIGALNGAAGTYGSTVITSLHYAQQQPTDTGIGEGEEDLPYEVSTQYRIHYTGL